SGERCVRPHHPELTEPGPGPAAVHATPHAGLAIPFRHRCAAGPLRSDEDQAPIMRRIGRDEHRRAGYAASGEKLWQNSPMSLEDWQLCIV
ncbi:MAG: hypothetical protein KC983_10810, partial [Phycisphaerales bacterium]|nr:hypothetical protein [Phycisphaerales bacterium]